MSQAHLETYLDNLDPSRLFFTQQEITEFAKWESVLDDFGQDGELSPAFTMYETYANSAEKRLSDVIETLPALVTNFDFDKTEFTEADPTDRAWAASSGWPSGGVNIKSQALSLKLADKPIDEIAPTLIKRYQNQLMHTEQRTRHFCALCQRARDAI